MGVCVSYPMAGLATMVKRIQILVDDDTHEDLKDEKGDRTWLEMLEAGAETDSEANA